MKSNQHPRSHEQLEVREAEQHVLGALLLAPKIIDKLADMLRPLDFSAPHHRLIYACMLRLAAMPRDEASSHPAIDAVTISTQLGHEGQLEQCGGLTYLLNLSEAVATAVNIEHHVSIVRNAADLRRLASVGDAIRVLAEGGDPVARSGGRFDTESAKARIEAATDLLLRTFQEERTPQAVALREAMRAVVKVSEERRKAPLSAVVGLSTGLIDLDGILRGLRRGALYIVGARPKIGKTAFGMHLALAAAYAGVGVLYVTTEVNAQILALRTLATLSQINTEAIETGSYDDEASARLGASVDGAPWADNLIVVNRPGATLAEIDREIRRFPLRAKVPPIGLVAVDHIGQMREPGANREREVSGISNGLLMLATLWDVPVVAMSQLSRECEKRRGPDGRTDARPKPSDLRDSGMLEADAMAVILLYRDEVYHPKTEDVGILEIKVALHRMGRNDRVRARYDDTTQRISNLADGTRWNT